MLMITLTYIIHYIILNNGILKSNSSIFSRSKGYITEYTPQGVYGLIVNENNEVNISLMIVKNDIMSVLGLNLGYTVKYTGLLREFPRASPSGTPSGKGLYLTVYPSCRPNTDTVSSIYI